MGRKIFQPKQQENMEKVYRKIEQEMGREEKGGERDWGGRLGIKSILGREGGQDKDKTI